MAKVRFNINNLSDVRMKDLMQKVRRHGQAAVLGITVAGIVMAVPILLILIAGIVVGLTVYAAAALILISIDAVRNLVSGGSTQTSVDQPPRPDDFNSEGRQNVRVIRER